VQDVELDRRESVKAERMRGGRRHIDDAPAHERAAIVDAHHGAAAVTQVGHADFGAER
jgi:hypothetical protein